MTSPLEETFDRLSSTQREAAEWGDGAALILAGPGVGKTTVLTARIARILNTSRNKHFRILALTFTTKAGDEMRTRVEELVPGLIDRTVIGTFHSFCAQILRQHGSHVGIKPDFAIYDQDEDRLELLKDALREAAGKGESVTEEDIRWLKIIDQLRSNLISSNKTAAQFRDQREGEKAAKVYAIYEAALRARNVMDFNGMILDTCRLVHEVPAVAVRIRQSYPYWLIDEFQDTSPAQYRLVRFLAGDDFKNVFVVADDDQIIYQWAGASYKQIVKFREHFEPKLIQIVENRRCPPEVVEAANNLVRHNSDRTEGKERLVATRPSNGAAIFTRVYHTDVEEAAGVAGEIASTERSSWGKTAVLARTRSLLQPVLDGLKQKGVKAAILTRRDRFISPQFVWLQSCLDQSIHPTDKRGFIAMLDAANRVAGTDLDAGILLATAESSGHGYMEEWASVMVEAENDVAKRLGVMAKRLIESRSAWRSVVSEALAWLPETTGVEKGVISDAVEDKAAWEAATRAIKNDRGAGGTELAEMLQELALRPKEPPPDPEAVSLLTIHSAKGLEFDHVWVIGLAESVIPSWQSLKYGANPAELEEERRNCFVAITRTKKTLTITRAEQYRGWSKQPSRFLAEMGLAT